MSGDRERAISAAFSTLAGSFAAGFDTVEFYSSLTADCARLLDIDAAGLLLADGQGMLHLMAASSERTHEVENFQLQREEGPCLDCYRDGSPVLVADLAGEESRWPQFVRAATAAGFASVHALPMRLHETVLGALGLFGTRVGALGDDDLELGQALADVASLALVADKASADKIDISAQLQTALHGRIAVEQAKGVLAELGGLDMEQAFVALRRYARDHRCPLTDVAARTVSRELSADQLLEHVETPSS